MKKKKQTHYESSHYQYLKYGIGIVTYFEIIYKIARLLFILSIPATLQMVLYWTVGGYGNISKDIDLYAQTSFGNMGFSKAICSKQLINWEDAAVEMEFRCEKTTEITDVLDAGVLISS